MFREVIACLDGSLFAEKILPYARGVAGPMGAKLTLLRVVETEADRAAAKNYLRSFAERWGAEQTVKVAETDAASAIVEELRRNPSAIAAITTRGHSGLAEALLGSVAMDVIRGSRRPVILYRPRVDAAAREPSGEIRINSVVAALDGSEFSERILPFAAGIANSLGAELELVQVLQAEGAGRPVPAAASRDLLESSYLHRQAELIQKKYGLRANWDVLHGRPAEAICGHVRGRDNVMLAMTSRARAGLEQAVFGSVAGECVRRAGAPLLVYWPVP